MAVLDAFIDLNIRQIDQCSIFGVFSQKGTRIEIGIKLILLIQSAGVQT